MAEKTLQDVIERIVAEGQLTRNSGSHSIRTVKEIMREQTEETRSQTEELKNAIGKSAGATISATRSIASPAGDDNLTTGDDLEARREDQSWQSQTLKFLEEIAANTAGLGRPAPEKEKKDGGPTLIDIGLGAILAGGALGAAAGIVLGQLKVIETLIPPIETLRRRLRILFKRTIPRQFAQLTKSIRNSVRGLILAATIQFELIRGSFVAFGERFRKLLRPLQGIFAPVTDSVRGIGNYVGRITKSFTDAFDEIVKVFRAVNKFASGTTKVGKAVEPIQDGVRAVMGFFKGMGPVFKMVAKTVGTIFKPIGIIITVFDTIKGAMKGYEEEGIIGGIKGAIKGFVNSLIMAPLDMLKNGIAWIMGKFGVDPATVDAVKNFSFTESFNKIVDSVFQLPKKAIAWISDKFTSISETVGEFITNVMGDPVGFISKIIAAPYELLQKGVAWILSKLGFENAAEDVEGFDIAGKLKEVISGVIKLFTDAIDFYIGIFTKGADLIGGLVSGDYSISDVFKEILRNILPDPSKDRKWYDPIGLVQRSIPKSVYEYAGINPETGGVLEELPVRTPEVEVPDTTVAVKPTLDEEQLKKDTESAQRATRIEIPLETRSPVVGAATETDNVRVERPPVPQREGVRLQMDQEQTENAQQQQKASVIAMQSNVSQSTVNNTNVNNNSSVGITGTSGDPLDRSWGV